MGVFRYLGQEHRLKRNDLRNAYPPNSAQDGVLQQNQIKIAAPVIREYVLKWVNLCLRWQAWRQVIARVGPRWIRAARGGSCK